MAIISYLFKISAFLSFIKHSSQIAKLPNFQNYLGSNNAKSMKNISMEVRSLEKSGTREVITFLYFLFKLKVALLH